MISHLVNYFTSVADPDPVSGALWPLDPGSRMEKIQIQDLGSGINIPDLIFGWKVFWGKKFFHADTDPESGILSTLDPGSRKEKSDPG